MKNTQLASGQQLVSYHPPYEKLLRQIFKSLKSHNRCLHLTTIRAIFKRNFIPRYQFPPTWSKILYRRICAIEEAGVVKRCKPGSLYFCLVARDGSSNSMARFKSRLDKKPNPNFNHPTTQKSFSIYTNTNNTSSHLLTPPPSSIGMLMDNTSSAIRKDKASFFHPHPYPINDRNKDSPNHSPCSDKKFNQPLLDPLSDLELDPATQDQWPSQPTPERISQTVEALILDCELRTKNDEWDSAKLGFRLQIQSLLNQVDALHAKESNQAALISLQEAACTELRASYDEAVNSIANLQEELNGTQDKLETILQESQTESANKLEQINSLKAKIVYEQGKFEETLKDHKHVWKNERVELTMLISALEQENLVLHSKATELGSMTDELQSIKSAIEQYNAAAIQLEADLEQVNGRNANVKKVCQEILQRVQSI